jgi:hypothetical protein
MKSSASWRVFRVTIGLLTSTTVFGAASSGPASRYMDVYQVGKAVGDFPEAEDFSRPETAYAAINRVMASGEDGAWQRISVPELASRLPAADAPSVQVAPERAAMYRNAAILEVRIFMGLRGVVIARLTKPDGQSRFDVRRVRFVQGRWLNAGQDLADSIEGARGIFARACAGFIEKPVRPKPADPDAFLNEFVEHLKSQGREPKLFVMELLARHRVVLMGEIHHRPRYWSFNASLVTEPAFAERVGAIYLELSANDQDMMDRFLAAGELDTQLAIEALRGMMDMGWPDQPMLDFMVTVWKVNQALPVGRKLRIVLVDMPRPWKEMRERADMRRFNVDRDRLMADAVLRDLRTHEADKRAGLFIVGAGHAMLDLQYFDGTPLTKAGYYLQKALGRDKVTAVFPHTCAMTNMGQISGRLCDGLFESAFRAAGNKSLAFPLATGPFGRQPFDAFPDEPAANSYKDGYDACLYLGPLEDERFSPLIPGFYTDEFVKEVDRRYRLESGKGWAEAYGRRLSAESFVEWMSTSWGQPRRGWTAESLGPLDTWRNAGKRTRSAGN